VPVLCHRDQPRDLVLDPTGAVSLRPVTETAALRRPRRGTWPLRRLHLPADRSTSSFPVLRRSLGIARMGRSMLCGAGCDRSGWMPRGSGRLTLARAVRASIRARRSGSGVRRSNVALETTWTAVCTSVRQATWIASGRAPGRVRSQTPTMSPSSISGAVAPRIFAGHTPVASSGRWVTPTVGRSTVAPSWSARPA